jgi:hypothetical protein
MSRIRKAVIIYEEDSAMTLLKPTSGEFLNQLFVIYENAYGEAFMKIELIEDVRIRLNITNEEFNEILNEIGL